MIFYQMKLGTSAIPHFHVILTGQSISKIILNIQSHLQGQKVNFKVISEKISFLTSKARNACNTSFHVILTEKSIHNMILVILVHLQCHSLNMM